MNRINLCSAARQKAQQILQSVRFRTKNDDGDCSVSQILLVFDALIHGKKNIKFGRFRRAQKRAILQPSEPCVTGGLAIVIGQVVPESLIDAFIDQNAHLRACKEKLLRFFEGGDGQFTRNRRKPL